MKHPAAFCAGFAAATFGLFGPYLLLILHCCQGPWGVYVFRCVLTTAGYTLTALAAGRFAQCVSAYKDMSAEVTGYCRPVREKVP